MGYWSGLALCLTKVRSSRARCPATALIIFIGKVDQSSIENLSFLFFLMRIPELHVQLIV